MPLFLASPSHAYVWYWSMLTGDSGQNCFGITEAMNITGKHVSPWVTHDTKLTTVFAMLGGMIDDIREMLMEDGVYSLFVETVQNEWNLVFGDKLEGEELDFALPPGNIPVGMGKLPSWTSCSATDNVCICPSSQQSEKEQDYVEY